MAEFLSPGVFIEEVPSSVQTIAGVSTSNVAILGWSLKGPEDEATLITSTDQFYREFGNLSPDTFAGLSVLAFFANGGRRCFFIRITPSDASEADLDIQSKQYDQEIDTGDDATVIFSKTNLTTTLVVNSGTTPVIAKNASNVSTFGVRWRHNGTVVTAERVKARDDSTDVDLVDGTPVYEFQISTASLAAYTEEDWALDVVEPGSVTINFDPIGGGSQSIAITAPVSGSVTTVNGNGTTTDSATVVVFDHATGRGSIRFGAQNVGDEPDSSVVAASLTLDFTPTSTTRKIADDGAGALVDVTAGALTGPGTIDYNDGSYSFTATTAPHDNAAILATYSIAAWDADPVSKGVWADSVKMQVTGNANYYTAATQSYTRHDVVIAELSPETGLYVVQESYEELVFDDSTSAEYFADVINELSDIVSIDVPGGGEAPGSLNGQLNTVVLGGGEDTAAAGTFGGTGAELLSTYLSDQGLDVGARSVSITYTSLGAQAIGSLTTDVQANFVDNDYFDLDDGTNPPTRFEFDQSGGATIPGTSVEIDISADVTADNVRDSIVTAINLITTGLLIQATGLVASTVALVNSQYKEANQTIVSSVSAGAWATTGMASGVDELAKTIADDGNGLLTGDVDPAYATTITVSGVDILPNAISYALGVANFKTVIAPAGGSVILATSYTSPEEAVHDEIFGDTSKTFTDSLAVVHYAGGSDGTFTSSTYSRAQFTNPTLSATNKGLYALNTIDEIMQVVVPDFAGDVTVTGDLLDYAATRESQPSGGDRFIILSVPIGSDAQEAVDWFRFDLGRFSKFAALYWPHIKVADPLANGRPLVVPPMGHVAGVYARTDTTRSVGKAPGGTVDGALNFLLGLEVSPTQGDRDFVYPNKINPLISSAQTGLAVWGVRTIAIESEWRYVHARRMFMFLEKSVFNATGWIVFENNGVALWSRIKVQLDGFMNNQFNEGMFYGSSPSDAYFVVVDDSNNSTSSIDAGQVIIDVAAAPNRPAEFVRFRFSQKAIS